MARIVVVDDDPDIRGMLAAYLGGLGHDVTLAESGAELQAMVDAGPCGDLFLLDVRLPGADGFALVRMLRARLDPGIVMLTGSGDPTDRIVGLEVGADDYLNKPVALTELSARIDAVLRRRTPADRSGLRFGPYRFDMAAFELLDAGGKLVELTPMEVDLVAAFASHPGKVLSREALLRLAPPREEDSLDRTIDQRVTRLRNKLESDPRHPQLLKTVRGAGYIFPG